MLDYNLELGSRYFIHPTQLCSKNTALVLYFLVLKNIIPASFFWILGMSEQFVNMGYTENIMTR